MSDEFIFRKKKAKRFTVQRPHQHSAGSKFEGKPLKREGGGLMYRNRCQCLSVILAARSKLLEIKARKYGPSINETKAKYVVIKVKNRREPTVWKISDM